MRCAPLHLAAPASIQPDAGSIEVSDGRPRALCSPISRLQRRGTGLRLAAIALAEPQAHPCGAGARPTDPPARARQFASGASVARSERLPWQPGSPLHVSTPPRMIANFDSGTRRRSRPHHAQGASWQRAGRRRRRRPARSGARPHQLAWPVWQARRQSALARPQHRSEPRMRNRQPRRHCAWAR